MNLGRRGEHAQRSEYRRFNRALSTGLLLLIGAWFAIVAIALLGGVHAQFSFGGIYQDPPSVTGNSAGESLEGKSHE